MSPFYEHVLYIFDVFHFFYSTSSVFSLSSVDNSTAKFFESFIVKSLIDIEYYTGTLYWEIGAANVCVVTFASFIITKKKACVLVAFSFCCSNSV